jgi:hypothetical protein
MKELALQEELTNINLLFARERKEKTDALTDVLQWYKSLMISQVINWFISLTVFILKRNNSLFITYTERKKHESVKKCLI